MAALLTMTDGSSQSAKGAKGLTKSTKGWVGITKGLSGSVK